jgi:hypothetical protein
MSNLQASMTLQSPISISAEQRQYGLLWGWILPQVAERLELPSTPAALKLIYQAFKEYMGYDSMAGASQEKMSRFTYELLATMAIEFGVYIRLPYEPEPPVGKTMEDMELVELWPVNYKRYWN